MAPILSACFFVVFSLNLSVFAIVEKNNSNTIVKSGIEEALEMFKGAQTAFINGEVFQRNRDYESTVTCYANSLRLWRSNEAVYFNLAYCLCTLKRYDVAEWAAISGLEMSSLKGDEINLGIFIILLGNIYYESGNLKKAKDAYGLALRLPISEDSRSFIIERMGSIEIK